MVYGSVAVAYRHIGTRLESPGKITLGSGYSIGQGVAQGQV